LLRAYGPTAPCSHLDDPFASSLRKAAIEAAKTATFKPGLNNGKPAEYGLTLKYVFNPFKKKGEQEPNFDMPVKSGVLNGRALNLPSPRNPESHVDYVGVEIMVLIGEDGKVKEAGVIMGRQPFGYSAMDAACKAKFSPTLLNGEPIRVRGIIAYSFAPNR
jgi:outer membrane biosynthesis protein TonB